MVAMKCKWCGKQIRPEDGKHYVSYWCTCGYKRGLRKGGPNIKELLANPSGDLS